MSTLINIGATVYTNLVMGGGAPAPISGDILLENGDQILLETSTTEVDGVLILEG